MPLYPRRENKYSPPKNVEKQIRLFPRTRHSHWWGGYKMVLLLLVLTAAFCSNVFAHDEKHHKGKPIEGIITSVGNGEFTLESDGKSISVLTNEKTKIESESGTAITGSLKSGTKVKVFGTKLPGNKLAAKEILIQSNLESNGVVQPDTQVFHSSIVSSYLELSAALANDNLEGALEFYGKLKSDIALSKDTHFSVLKETISKDSLSSLQSVREEFASISEVLIPLLKKNELAENIVHAYCPMVSQGKGASWLQRGKEIRNPYFGAAMLDCGEVKN